MKTLSISGTIFLFLIALGSLIKVFEVYYEVVSPLVSEEIAGLLTKPAKIYAAIFFVFFFVSLILTIKKKYSANVIMSGTLVFIHLIIINFIGIEWLK